MQNQRGGYYQSECGAARGPVEHRPSGFQDYHEVEICPTKHFSYIKRKLFKVKLGGIAPQKRFWNAGQGCRIISGQYSGNFL
jgi:hypothetical protein